MKQLSIVLTQSDNEYIKYPCGGMLELFELGVNGTVICGVFRARDAVTGKLLAPVEVRNPRFAYDPNGYYPRSEGKS